MPIVGDPKYFNKENWQLPGGIQNRLHLLARRIAVPHPRGGMIDVTAPLPPHMVQSWNLLGPRPQALRPDRRCAGGMKINQTIQAQDELQPNSQHWEKRFAAPNISTGPCLMPSSSRRRALLPKSGKALAVADGEGRNGVWLAEQGLDVLSVDFSPKAPGQGEGAGGARGVTVRTVQADVTAWDWPTAEFDVIAVIFIQFCAPPERRRIFAGIRQALKPGGLLLLQGYRPEQIAYNTGGPSEVENLYSEDMLREEFGSFRKLDIRAHDSVVSEGSRHSGMAAVVDLGRIGNSAAARAETLHGLTACNLREQSIRLICRRPGRHESTR